MQLILNTGSYYKQHEYYNKLQYPVNIKTPNAKLAKVIISQLGGLNFKKILIFPISYEQECQAKVRESNRICLKNLHQIAAQSVKHRSCA